MMWSAIPPHGAWVVGRERLGECSGSGRSHTVQGPRPGQEDRYVVEPSPRARGERLSPGGDGRPRSAGAAEYCRRELLRCFRSPARRRRGRAAAAVRTLDEGTRLQRSGTTLSAVCLLDSHGTAAIAVLGDSPVFASTAGPADRQPGAQRPVNLGERRLAEARGGLYLSGYIVNAETGMGSRCRAGSATQSWRGSSPGATGVLGRARTRQPGGPRHRRPRGLLGGGRGGLRRRGPQGEARSRDPHPLGRAPGPPRQRHGSDLERLGCGWATVWAP